MGYKDSNMGKALQGKRKNLLVDDIVDKDTLAGYIGCDPKTITYYQKTLGLPFIPLGRDTYFRVRSIYKWLIERETMLLPEQKNRAKGKPSKGGKKVEI